MLQKQSQLLSLLLVPSGESPAMIVIDHDHAMVSEYTSNFWQTVWMCSELSSCHCPQTNGVAERVNRGVEKIIWSYLNHRRDDWHKFLCWADFANDDARHWMHTRDNQTSDLVDPKHMFKGAGKSLRRLNFTILYLEKVIIVSGSWSECVMLVAGTLLIHFHSCFPIGNQCQWCPSSPISVLHVFSLSSEFHDWSYSLTPICNF